MKSIMIVAATHSWMKLVSLEIAGREQYYTFYGALYLP